MKMAGSPSVIATLIQCECVKCTRNTATMKHMLNGRSASIQKDGAKTERCQTSPNTQNQVTNPTTRAIRPVNNVNKYFMRLFLPPPPSWFFPFDPANDGQDNGEEHGIGNEQNDILWYEERPTTNQYRVHRQYHPSLPAVGRAPAPAIGLGRKPKLFFVGFHSLSGWYQDEVDANGFAEFFELFHLLFRPEKWFVPESVAARAPCEF